MVPFRVLSTARNFYTSLISTQRPASLHSDPTTPESPCYRNPYYSFELLLISKNNTMPPTTTTMKRAATPDVGGVEVTEVPIFLQSELGCCCCCCEIIIIIQSCASRLVSPPLRHHALLPPPPRRKITTIKKIAAYSSRRHIMGPSEKKKTEERGARACARVGDDAGGGSWCRGFKLA